MANKYSFNIEWSEEDQEYVASCPSFPTLLAFGRTEEEALKEGKIALKGFIETCEANNISLPESLARETFSGKLQLRLPKSLHRIAAQMAPVEGVSLNSYISDAVRTRVSSEQFGTRALSAIRMAAAAGLSVPRGRTTHTYTKRTETEQFSIEDGLSLKVGSETRKDH